MEGRVTSLVVDEEATEMMVEVVEEEEVYKGGIDDISQSSSDVYVRPGDEGILRFVGRSDFC